MRAFRHVPQIITLVSLAVLCGCGGGGGGSAPPAASNPAPPAPPAPPSPPAPAAVAGAVQKGPFILGSTVLVNKLDNLGNPTNSTILTQIKDSVGSFSFTADGTGPVQMVASGYYFSELTGQISTSTLTLRGIYDVGGAATQTAYVNIMTHLINERVLALIGRGVTVTNALSQAEREFLDAFATALPTANLGQFSTLSVYDTASTSDAGNAYLLALSTGFYKYSKTKAEELGTSTDAELTLLLNRISHDLADDGRLQLDFMGDFVKAIRSLSPTEIAANLRRRSVVDYPAGLGVPDISRFLNQCAGAAKCAWRSGAPMPLPSRGHAVVEFGGKLYVFGGTTAADISNGSLGAQPATLYRSARVYDPVANTWTDLAPMPLGASDLEAHSIGGKIYVLAGYGVGGFRNELMQYDPVANAWTLKTPSPTYRYLFTSAVVGDRIYVIGGEGTVDDGPWASGKQWALKDRVSAYDSAGDSWSQAHAAPQPFSDAASCALGNKIYVFGGITAAGKEAFTLMYDTASDSWSSKSPASIAKDGFDCVRVSDLFYVLGGRNAAGAALDEVTRYDPATDTWASPTRLPTARYWFDADAAGGEIFVIGGQGGSPESLKDVVEIVNPIL